MIEIIFLIIVVGFFILLLLYSTTLLIQVAWKNHDNIGKVIFIFVYGLMGALELMLIISVATALLKAIAIRII
jgi:hypothetical protein